MSTIGMYKKHKKVWILVGVTICIIAVVATLAIPVWRSSTPNSGNPGVWLKIVTDKKTYAQGENVTYTIIIVNNNATENFTLVNPSYNLDIYKKEPLGDVYLYSIGHEIEITEAPYKVIQPKSEEFIIEDVWQPIDSLTPLPSGEYILRIKLGYAEDINGETVIEIL